MQPKLTIDTNAAFTYHIPMINLGELGEQGSGNTGIDYNTRRVKGRVGRVKLRVSLAIGSTKVTHGNISFGRCLLFSCFSGSGSPL